MPASDSAVAEREAPAGARCPVCRWPAASTEHCATCGWLLNGDFLLGAATAGDEEAFDGALTAARRRFDLAAAVRAAGYPAAGDPAALARMTSYVRGGAVCPAERDAAIAAARAGPAPPARSGAPPPASVVEIGIGGVRARATVPDGHGHRRERAEPAEWTWAALVPQLSSDPDERALQLAGGAGRSELPPEAVRDAVLEGLDGVLAGQERPAGLRGALPGWTVLQSAMERLARRHPGVVVLPAVPGGPGAVTCLRFPAGITAFAAPAEAAPTDPAPVVVAELDAGLTAWSLPGGTRTAAQRLPAGRITALAVGRDTLVAAGDQDGVVHLWSTRAGTVRVAARHAGWINAVAIAADLLFTLGDDGLLRRITVTGDRGGLGIPIEVGWSAASALAVSADAAVVATAGSEGVVRLWRGTSGEYAGAIEVGAAVSALAIDPDGRSLAVGTLDGALRLYSLTARTLQAEVPGDGGPVRAVLAALRHDWIAAGDDSGAVRLWPMRAGRITGTGTVLGLHGGPVRGLGALAGGEPVSADADGIVRVWSERPPAGGRRHEDTEAR
jgi:hypothetical protein